MSNKKPTLEELLKKIPDGQLMDIELELLEAVIPTDGATHAFRRKVNKMIDRGECCINATSYRKVYLPTLAKAVHKESARRYISALKTGIILPDEQIALEELSC